MIRPPRLGKYFLKKIYDENIYDEIAGDLQEIFIERVESKNKYYATFKYIIDVLLSTRNYHLRRRKKIIHKNSTAMIKNYFKITIRTIVKNKVYSALNILGLALGISAFIFILQYVSYENSYDKFHSNHEDLYRIRYKVYQGEDLSIDCAAAVPRVGPFMKEKMPEVVEFARAFPTGGVMVKDNIKFRENRIQIVDPSFLNIFDFPLLHGAKENLLKEPNEVVITETIARKYFGKTDVLGEELTYHGWMGPTLEIVGVALDVPNNSHLKFDFLISYESLNSRTRNAETGISGSETSWGWYDFNSYVQLQEGTDPVAFDKKFNDVLWDELGEDFEKRNRHSEFPLQAITDIHLYSNLLQESEPEEQGDGEAVFFLSIVAFFILIIAWVNYINLSTARSVERAKEVGIRKTMGAYRKQLIYQFLTEAVVLNFLALVIGLIIVVAGIRSFNNLTGSLLSLDFLKSSQFWLVAGGVFIAGSTLSGLYPAFVLSSFKPSAVLKGKFSGNSSGVVLRKVLVVFQFAASVSLITGTIIVAQQLTHMTNVNLGFDMAGTLVLKGPAVGVDSLYDSKYEAFRNELLSNKEIENVTASSNVPGAEIFWTNGIKRHEDGRDKWKSIFIAGIDYDYFPTYDIEFLVGRNYGKTFSTDTGAIILNHSAVRYLGFESPEDALSQKVTFWGQPKTIIGVVDDYRQMSVKSDVNPMAFPLSIGQTGYFTLKLKTENYGETFDLSKATYDEFFPGNPFDYFLLDEFFNRQYNNERQFSSVFTLFAIFGIIVACLGLFGLSSFSALQRTKEIGIRKTLGASMSSILFILSKEFMILIAIANVIAWPIIYFVMNGWLDNFASRISIGVWVFVISGITVLIVAILTVSIKTLKTAKSNPIEALRYE